MTLQRRRADTRFLQLRRGAGGRCEALNPVAVALGGDPHFPQRCCLPRSRNPLKSCDSVAVLEDLAHRFALRWTQLGGATGVLTNAVTHECLVLALALAHEADIAAFVCKGR